MKNIDRVLDEARADMMPFDSWELLPKESTEAYAAFCVYRNLGFKRSIRLAFDSVADNDAYSKSYGSWRKWAVEYRWKQRAADFDRCNEQIKQTENRKTIEAQAEKQREVTAKMLDVVNKKLDTMKPEDLPVNGVTIWVEAVNKSNKDIAEIIQTTVMTPNGQIENKQGEFNFVSDFKGL
jgi:hypothetical protein